MSSREYGDEDDPLVETICPECEVAKHSACNGASWDHDRDEPAICSCWRAGHHLTI